MTGTHQTMKLESTTASADAHTLRFGVAQTDTKKDELLRLHNAEVRTEKLRFEDALPALLEDGLTMQAWFLLLHQKTQLRFLLGILLLVSMGCTEKRI